MLPYIYFANSCYKNIYEQFTKTNNIKESFYSFKWLYQRTGSPADETTITVKNVHRQALCFPY